MSETVLIAILSALGAAIGGVALWLRAHDAACRTRWETLLQSHGGIKADVATLKERLLRDER